MKCKLCNDGDQRIQYALNENGKIIGFVYLHKTGDSYVNCADSEFTVKKYKTAEALEL